MEAADSNTAALKTRETMVHQVKDRVTQATESKTCFHCSRTGHFPKNCKFKDAFCHACSKKGHVPLVCKSVPHKKAALEQGLPGRSQRRYRKTNRVQGDQEAREVESSGSSSSSGEYVFHHVGNHSVDPVYVQVEINGKPLKMEIDSGAARSIISEKIS